MNISAFNLFSGLCCFYTKWLKIQFVRTQRPIALRFRFKSHLDSLWCLELSTISLLPGWFLEVITAQQEWADKLNGQILFCVCVCLCMYKCNECGSPYNDLCWPLLKKQQNCRAWKEFCPKKLHIFQSFFLYFLPLLLLFKRRTSKLQSGEFTRSVPVNDWSPIVALFCCKKQRH